MTTPTTTDELRSLIARERETMAAMQDGADRACLDWIKASSALSAAARIALPALCDAADERDALREKVARLRTALERVAASDFLRFSLAPQRSAHSIARAALDRTS